MPLATEFADAWPWLAVLFGAVLGGLVWSLRGEWLPSIGLVAIVAGTVAGVLHFVGMI